MNHQSDYKWIIWLHVNAPTLLFSIQHPCSCFTGIWLIEVLHKWHLLYNNIWNIFTITLSSLTVSCLQGQMDRSSSISALPTMITVIFCLVIVRRGQLALYIISPVLTICLFGILSYLQCISGYSWGLHWAASFVLESSKT